MAGVMKNIDEAMDLITAKDRDIMRYGRSLMKKSTKKAFTQKADPATGAPWARRKESYPWPLLRNTSELWRSLRWGYGIKTKNKRLKFFGKIAGSYPQAIIRAGAVHFGRSKARTAAGGKRIGVAPSTGVTPPRPLFGFGRSQRKRIKRYAEKRLAKVFR
jgi:phage gpG-like protein